MIHGELLVVDDVPAAFAAAVVDTVASATAGASFRLGCSGGASGAHCFGRLAEEDLPWSMVECFFVDERCVPAGSPDSNAVAIAAALGPRREALAGFYPMSCEEGPEPYAALVAAGGFDLLQLGVGPDGHTASLFPESHGDDLPADTYVFRNSDPSGRNPFERLTLTFAGISLARRIVITVIGADKADVLARVEAGEDLPVGRVRGGSVLWLVDREAGARLGPRVGQ